MGDLLDMQEYRARQRARNRLAEDAKKASTHSAWAYGPEGLSGGPGEPGDAIPVTDITGKVTMLPAGVRRGEMNVLSSSNGTGKSALHKAHAAAQVDAYINDIVERAGRGQAWAKFLMAALQCTDMTPGAARESMQLAFPNMEPAKFETWLEKATEEFDEYSNILDRES